MIDKIIWALRIAGWTCFAMAMISFVGIMDYFGTVDEARDSLMQGMFSEAFGLPDFKTIAWCALGIIIGLVLLKLSSRYGRQSVGNRLIAAGIVCIVLTFTPLSMVSFMPASLAVAEDEIAPDGYEEINFDFGQLYAFLGSKDSQPEDVDIFEYKQGYNGEAKDVYRTYKICGWLINNSDEIWSQVVLEFVLLDADGNDIMLDGQPVVLRNAEDFDSDLGVIAGSVGRFETNVIKAKDLPNGVTPVHFRVQSARKVYYEPADI